MITYCSTFGKIVGQRRLLGAINCERVVVFDGHPSSDVCANETGQRRHPFRDVLVAFRSVRTTGDGYQLGSSEVISECFALSGGPVSRP